MHSFIICALSNNTQQYQVLSFFQPIFCCFYISLDAPLVNHSKSWVIAQAPKMIRFHIAMPTRVMRFTIFENFFAHITNRSHILLTMDESCINATFFIFEVLSFFVFLLRLSPGTLFPLNFFISNCLSFFPRFFFFGIFLLLMTLLLSLAPLSLSTLLFVFFFAFGFLCVTTATFLYCRTFSLFFSLHNRRTHGSDSKVISSSNVCFSFFSDNLFSFIDADQNFVEFICTTGILYS